MTEIEILNNQTKDAYQWVQKLIETIPDEKWDKTADVLESNINWQIGHLVISIYYHSILVIRGHQKDVFEQIPLKKYSELYTFDATPKNAIGKISPLELRDHLDIVEKISLEIISSLSPEELQTELVPGQVEHPVAKTKFGAIDWNVKHTMWHCGQMAILKRVLGESYDFGLKKPD